VLVDLARSSAELRALLARTAAHCSPLPVFRQREGDQGGQAVVRLLGPRPVFDEVQPLLR
jgi:hypothetical protein